MVDSGGHRYSPSLGILSDFFTLNTSSLRIISSSPAPQLSSPNDLTNRNPYLGTLSEAVASLIHKVIILITQEQLQTHA
jgi:hypothetical protein